MPTVSQIATEKILNIIQSGQQLQWKFYQLAPMNFISKRAYTGSNHFLLLFAQGMKSPYYLTFHQIKELGLSLKKGSKGEIVVYKKYPQYIRNEDGELSNEREGYFMLRYYHVFNAADVEGITLPIHTNSQPNVDAFLSSISFVPIKYKATDLARYNYDSHVIISPYKERFVSSEEYYSAIFHELGHSTAPYFKRSLTTDKRSAEYKQEELLAEMTSVFLCAHFGIETTFRNSAAYLEHYARGDSKNILSVISDAEKAARYILSNGNPSEATTAPE